jgi:hypothetical protein
VKGWVIPPQQSGEFVANMEHVLDVYKRPYNEKYPVICMDESPKQLIEDIATVAMRPGQEARADYEYIRHGMVNIFMANEPLKGKRIVEVTKNKKKSDWAQFMKKVAESYPTADKICMVMDNFKTHHASAFYENFKPEEARTLCKQFEFVYTPKHGSWLNMAEIELHVLNHQCLNRHIPEQNKVEYEVKAWEKDRNSRQIIINWQFTNEKARVKLKRLYPSLHD